MAYMKDSTGRRLDALPAISAVKTQKNIGGTSNATLTTAETASRLLELTSATQTITITVPIGASFALTNSTDFPQTIKRAGATKTVTLESGDSMEIQS